jgi:hypothetical protein
MRMSLHAKERAAQRLCYASDLDLALTYGDYRTGGILVTKKVVLRAEREATEARRRAQRLRRLLDMYAPIGEDGTIITVQRVTHRKRKRIMRSKAFR